jgi:hypothetical protein
MEKASDFLVGFIRKHYSSEKLTKFLPFTEDSLYDLEDDIAHRFEYALVNKQENGETIDQQLLDDATRAGDELRDKDIDLKDLEERLTK